MQNKSIKILGTATKPNTPKYAWRTVTNPEEIAEIERKSRQQFLKRFASQALLQALTFTGAIGVYHTIALPQLTHEAVQEAKGFGWRNAVEQVCPLAKDTLGG
jgi:hypothetical protein